MCECQQPMRLALRSIRMPVQRRPHLAAVLLARQPSRLLRLHQLEQGRSAWHSLRAPAMVELFPRTNTRSTERRGRTVRPEQLLLRLSLQDFQTPQPTQYASVRSAKLATVKRQIRSTALPQTCRRHRTLQRRQGGMLRWRCRGQHHQTVEQRLLTMLFSGRVTAGRRGRRSPMEPARRPAPLSLGSRMARPTCSVLRPSMLLDRARTHPPLRRQRLLLAVAVAVRPARST